MVLSASASDGTKNSDRVFDANNGKAGPKGNDGWGGVNLTRYHGSMTNTASIAEWLTFWDVKPNGNNDDNDNNSIFIFSRFTFTNSDAYPNTDINNNFTSDGSFFENGWDVTSTAGIVDDYILERITPEGYVQKGLITWLKLFISVENDVKSDSTKVRSNSEQYFYVTEGITSAICYDYSAFNSNTD